MAKRIGILTGGGDCPGLNAVIRAVVNSAQGCYGWEVVGILDAFEGLYRGEHVDLHLASVRDLLPRGGTILGSSNRGDPFSFPVVEEGREIVKDVSATCMDNLAKLGVDALIVVGGDGTMGIAKRLMSLGARIVGIPKTIDNDLEATEYTVGFQTAVETVTDALDRLRTTAESHDRIIICEVMGRYAGWIALVAGLAGGADVILIPEIDYDIDRVIAAFDRSHQRGVTFSLVVVAEGAKPKDGSYAEVRAADATQQAKLGGAGQRLADEIRSRSKYDIRVTVLGHIQRGGSPCAFDRELATRFGYKAVELIAANAYGEVVALRADKIVTAPIEKAVRKLKLIEPDGDLVRAARATGVELGA